MTTLVPRIAASLGGERYNLEFREDGAPKTLPRQEQTCELADFSKMGFLLQLLLMVATLLVVPLLF